jgi:hypothetical protein
VEIIMHRMTYDDRTDWTPFRRPGALGQHGAVIAVAELVWIGPTENMGNGIGADNRSLGDFSPGRFAWELRNVRPVYPAIKCRGKQGLWTLPHEVENEILRRGAWKCSPPDVHDFTIPLSPEQAAAIGNMPCVDCLGSFVPKKGGT